MALDQIISCPTDQELDWRLRCSAVGPGGKDLCESLMGYPADQDLLYWHVQSAVSQLDKPTNNWDYVDMDLEFPKILPGGPGEYLCESLFDDSSDEEFLICCPFESVAGQPGNGPAMNQCVDMDSESAKCLPCDPFGMNLGFNLYDLVERLPHDPFEMDIPTSIDAINSGQVFTSADLASTMSSPMIFDESKASNAFSEIDVQSPSAPFSTTGQVHEGLVFALRYLGVKDLLSVEQVCKSLNEAVRSEPLLWMSIQFDSAWRDILNDETLLKVTRKAKGNLRTLGMVSCGNVSNEGLRCVLEENPLLTKLYVPDCVNLSLDSLITNLKSFNSRNYPGIQHLKLGRLFRISESQYNELIAVLRTNSYRPTAQPKPHLYHIARFSIMCNEDRALDIETCPRCRGLKLVYDCPLDGCKGDNGTCRGCEACIRRCLLCGKCIPDDSTYDETFNYDHLCGICRCKFWSLS